MKFSIPTNNKKIGIKCDGTGSKEWKESIIFH